MRRELPAGTAQRYTHPMRIGIVQARFPRGAVQRNVESICHFLGEARAQRCGVVLFPEEALHGGPHHGLPRDVGARQLDSTALERVVSAAGGMSLALGIDRPPAWAISSKGGAQELLPTRSAAVIENGVLRVETGSARVALPALRLEALNAEVRIGDRWARGDEIASDGLTKGAWLVALSSSPFRYGDDADGGCTVRRWAATRGMGLACVRGVGLHDEQILRGGSFIVDPTGRLVMHAPWFEDGLFVADLDDSEAAWPDDTAEVVLRQALVRGLRDFVADTGLSRVIIGLSGGIDSAVVTCLAVDALGPDAVTAVFLPSEFTGEESRSGAFEIARRLGVELVEMSIEPLHHQARAVMPELPVGLTDENLQPRLRAVLLMGLANQRNALVLCPGNKSEIAVGYSTLYGDTVGAVAPLGDLYKADVYRLAEQFSEAIPVAVRERPPSAELRLGQRDDEDLPSYSILDPILAALLEERVRRDDLIADGSDPRIVDWVIERHHASAYKRGQLPPVLRVR